MKHFFPFGLPDIALYFIILYVFFLDMRLFFLKQNAIIHKIKNFQGVGNLTWKNYPEMIENKEKKFNFHGYIIKQRVLFLQHGSGGKIKL